MQDSLRSAIKMEFSGPAPVVCLYIDASEEMWASIVSQTKEKELHQPVGQQKHELLAFLGGKFK